MKVIGGGVIALSFASIYIIHELNNLIYNGSALLGNGVSYILDEASKSWKYSLSFIESTHEGQLNKMIKEKEKNDLQRKIRIGNIESELEEGNALIEKGMPNYFKLQSMFGDSLPKQYELANHIQIMKDTLFVSESLSSLSIIIKQQIGDELEKMNMKKIVDKIIEKNMFDDIQFMLYEQQMKNKYLHNVIGYERNDVREFIVILNDAVSNYENAWTMNIANELLDAANKEFSNLSYIDYNFISTNNNFELNLNEDKIIPKSKNSPNDLYKVSEIHKKHCVNKKQDPCKRQPYEPKSVWKELSAC